ncbi:MAG: DUF1847 domain-containing protein [Actinobacteria bacterium]|nr:DUF1847 domain-containing protein [Actinomycetota bacterium]
MKKPVKCTACAAPLCYLNVFDHAPAFCPSVVYKEEIEEESENLIRGELSEVARVSSVVEGVNYCRKTRVEEMIDFARRLGLQKLGIAFCVGLRKEAATLADILESRGFEVVAVCCKLGGISKERFGVRDEEKINPGTYEGACNPAAQALVLEREGSQLNILLGLCVGHDSIFIATTRVLTTVLATKDRVTGHCPLQPVYLAESYYGKIKTAAE